MVAKRKEERRLVSRTLHLPPGGPSGLHLSMISRQLDNNNWRLERNMMMTQGGREGDNVWANVLKQTTVRLTNQPEIPLEADGSITLM